MSDIGIGMRPMVGVAGPQGPPQPVPEPSVQLPTALRAPGGPLSRGGAGPPGPAPAWAPGQSTGGYTPGPSYGAGSGGGGGDPPAPFDPLKYVSSLTMGAANNPAQARTVAQHLANYLQGLPIGEAEAVMKQLQGQKGGIQGTQIATDLYQALTGGGAGGAGTTAGQAGFDPLGLSQAFSTTIPKWLSGQEKESAALTKAGDASMHQALQGASPQIQAAYAATMPAMDQAQTDETRTMANLALTTPMFNEIVAGIQAMNTAYTGAKQAALAAPYTAATVQGGGIPGSTNPANVNTLTAGLQGPGIPAPGTAPGVAGAPGAATPGINPYALYQQLAAGGQAVP